MTVSAQFFATVYKKENLLVKNKVDIADIDEAELDDSAEVVFDHISIEDFAELKTQRKKFNIAGQKTQMIEKSKQLSGISPNIIHSYDAAHMQMTVLRLSKEYGIKSFSLIHDSFGTHCCDVDILQKVLREEFVSIYRVDQLAKLTNCFNQQLANKKRLQIKDGAVPKRGSFDINEVLDSEYFFA